MKRFLLTLIAVFVVFTSNAQSLSNLSIDSVSKSKFQFDSIRYALDWSKAIELKLPLFMKNGTSFAQFMGFYENGIPHYYITDNREAARTSSTQKVHPAGGLGLSLTGENMIVGEWDGGAVRGTHQELTGRVIQIDGSGTNSDHATHVAGTIMASGVQASAKGMAYKATLNAYDWSFDESEMDQAAQNGLFLSNHSYGSITGWYENKANSRWEWYGDTSISATIDWKYGFYNEQARDWDVIANKYPNYLMVKSAGNDRGQKLPTNIKTHYVFDGSLGQWVKSGTVRATAGPYDCISGAGVSKNVLTVGAVNAINSGWTKSSDVVMSSFSGWGPTDDGRIKPDLVANGVQVYSPTASSNTSYDTYQGTSMASPATTGSLLLLQEHYKNVFGTLMNASTLKGLAIHTSDEAGTADGPDYSFGWGLLNTAKAALTISDTLGSRMITARLNNNSKFEAVVYSDGTKPLWATICWNDPAATPSTPSLNPTNKTLINDLDLSIVYVADSTENMPWILDPATPDKAAAKGDNTIDNVEKVEIKNPKAGFYKVVIKHKGNLSGNKQDFSLIISGESPKLQADFEVASQTCVGKQIQFTPKILGEPTAYQWSFPGGTPEFSSLANPTVSYSIKGKFDVKLRVSNPATIDSITKIEIVEILDKPQIVFTPFSGSFCSEDSTSVPLISSPSGLFSGVGVQAATGTFIPKIAGAGTHSLVVTYTDTFNCTNYDTTEVLVKKSPDKPGVQYTNDLLSTNASAISFQWYDQNGAINNAKNSTFTIIKSGFYQVGIKDSTGCERLSDKIFAAKTSVANKFKTDISIKPNPASDFVLIKSDVRIKAYEIRQVDGKILLADYMINEKSVTIDSKSLNPAFYTLRILFEDDNSLDYKLLILK